VPVDGSGSFPPSFKLSRSWLRRSIARRASRLLGRRRYLIITFKRSDGHGSVPMSRWRRFRTNLRSTNSGCLLMAIPQCRSAGWWIFNSTGPLRLGFGAWRDLLLGSNSTSPMGPHHGWRRTMKT